MVAADGPAYVDEPLDVDSSVLCSDCSRDYAVVELSLFID